MPIYEYQCDSCQKVIEVIQKFSDLPLAKCEVCGGSLARLISKTSFQLKGTGWYATDYKKKPSGSDASGKDSNEPAAKPAVEPKADSSKGPSPSASTPCKKGGCGS